MPPSLTRADTEARKADTVCVGTQRQPRNQTQNSFLRVPTHDPELRPLYREGVLSGPES